MGVGQVQDHALLMACMFRACKYESYEDVVKEFQEKQEKDYKSEAKRMQKLVNDA